MFGQSMLKPTPRNYNRDLNGGTTALKSNMPDKTSLRSNLPKPTSVGPKKALNIGRIPSATRGGFKNSKLPPPRVIEKNEKEVLLKNLTPLQYRVTQEKQTERAYSNQFYKHFEPGTYSCVVCREPIFRSCTKYDSQSGWPAFYDIIDESKVTYKEDLTHVGANLLLLVCNPSLARIEVSCAVCKSHLGHAFEDGPKPTGKRYCVNSSSLVFNSALEGEILEGPKRTQEEQENTGDRKKRFGDHYDSKSSSNGEEPLVHMASPANSCAMGSRICFRVPNSMDALSQPMS